MNNLIKEAITAAGYEMAYTKENLIECYLDYVDSFGGDLDDARNDIEDGSITLEVMCKRIIRSN